MPEFINSKRSTTLTLNLHVTIAAITIILDFLAYIFSDLNDMSLNLFHICHWKVYNGHYGDNSELGGLMIQAQVFIDF